MQFSCCGGQEVWLRPGVRQGPLERKAGGQERYVVQEGRPKGSRVRRSSPNFRGVRRTSPNAPKTWPREARTSENPRTPLRTSPKPGPVCRYLLDREQHDVTGCDGGVVGPRGPGPVTLPHPLHSVIAKLHKVGAPGVGLVVRGATQRTDANQAERKFAGPERGRLHALPPAAAAAGVQERPEEGDDARFAPWPAHRARRGEETAQAKTDQVVNVKIPATWTHATASTRSKCQP